MAATVLGPLRQGRKGPQVGALADLQDLVHGSLAPIVYIDGCGEGLAVGVA